MTEPSRLAALPGYDTAPDVYETPELTDDTSTTARTQTTSLRPGSSSEPTSDTGSDDEGDEDEDENEASFVGVSRRRLYPQRARSRFGAASGRVEARGVDLSDRVDGRRRGYKIRPWRGRDAGQRGDGGEQGEEGLEARIARLRREVEECRAAAEEEQQQRPAEDGGAGGGDYGDTAADGLHALSQLLADMEMQRERSLLAPQPTAAPANGTSAASATVRSAHDGGGEVTDEQTLSRVADFDARLATLEHALGISALDAAPSEAITTPVLPSLTVLEQQLSALSSAASHTGLEAASSRIARLRNEALSLAHVASTASANTSSANGEQGEGDDAAPLLSPADVQKLQHLYTLLPNLQSLSPTVPALLQRLRSLRTLHATAAAAAGALDDVEKRQAEMDAELKAWRGGLERVESAVAEASEANGRNGRVVEGWVRELETRVKVLR